MFKTFFFPGIGFHFHFHMLWYFIWQISPQKILILGILLLSSFISSNWSWKCVDGKYKFQIATSQKNCLPTNGKNVTLKFFINVSFLCRDVVKAFKAFEEEFLKSWKNGILSTICRPKPKHIACNSAIFMSQLPKRWSIQHARLTFAKIRAFSLKILRKKTPKTSAYGMSQV